MKAFLIHIVEPINRGDYQVIDSTKAGKVGGT